MLARLRLLLLITLSALALSASAMADAPEYAVKAAYLSKFASYVEWPEGSFSRADSPLVIAVIGADTLADELERIVVGQTVAGHPLQVRRLRPGDALTGTHILFIGHMDNTPPGDVLAATHGLPVLTVTESESDYALGSMINLLVADKRVRFEVALPPVDAGHLKISARMLSAAASVNRRQP